MGVLSALATIGDKLLGVVLSDGTNVLGTAGNPLVTKPALGSAATPLVVSIAAAPATVQTTSATPVNVILDTPPVSTARGVELLLSACKSDGTKSAAWKLYASVRCDSTGTLTIGAEATTIWSELDSSFAPAVDVNVSGANIVAVLTGVAVTTINWSLKSTVA